MIEESAETSADRVKVKPQALPLGRLYHWIETLRIDPTKPITLRELSESGCVNGIKAGGVKLVGDVSVISPILK